MLRYSFSTLLFASIVCVAGCKPGSITTSRPDTERSSDYASLSARVIQSSQLAQTNRYFILLGTEISGLRVIDCTEGRGSQSLSQLEASSDMEYSFRFNRPITEEEYRQLAGRLPQPKSLKAGLLYLTDSAGRWQESMEIIPYSSAADPSSLSLRLRARMEIVR